MTKEDTDLIGDAIDFYNLNHFKGKDTKKRLVTLKKEIKALTIPVVSVRKIVRCEDPMICLRGCSVHKQTCKHPIYER